ncbi:MAG TPA: Ig-like domain-containing protein, partial [Candidatus Thermoplasmatota archaeon]|nr:Ig-like domain-containing protein [Candidatus Thermoplasmatota archaeon]
LVLAEPEDAAASSCPAGVRTMEDVGPVCPRANGLFEVFSPDLSRSLGFLHGSDPVPDAADEVGVAAGGSSVACVGGAPGTYYIQVIYARAHDDADWYNQSVNMLRYMTGAANKLVDDAGIATGSPASLKVKCVGGQVEVKNEVLPTSRASASFSTIANDLYNRGYNDGKVKYWIFYDDTSACSCGGQGNIYGDSRLSADNWNNGNAGPMYAITYGYNSTRIWLHELGHNMGAVQNNAPHTSGGWHCNDGRDTMCYGDGGSNSSYSSGFCAVEVWDCGKDSYFNANPPAGSYLATKWNTGSVLNRFISFGVPSLASLSCTTPVEMGNATTCTFVAYDDSSGVRYTVDWGDGAVETVPSGSGYVPPGQPQSVSRTYASVGARTVTVGVVDETGMSGQPRAAQVVVAEELTRPVIVVLDPRPNMVYNGCGDAREAPVRTVRPIWYQTACVRLDATDDRSGIARVEVYVGGVLRATTTSAPYEFEFPVPQVQLSTPVHLSAIDGAGNRATVSVNVDMLRT